MKNLITIVIALYAALSLSATEFPTDYDYQRLNVDFRGVAINDNSILCYGSGSIILRSTDKGKTWEQSCVLHDGLDIMRIRWIKDKYVGIAHKDFMIVSEDDGKSWKTIDIGDEEPLLDIAGDEYNIYVLKENSIQMLLYKNLTPFNKIVIDTTNNIKEILDFKNKIYAPAENGILFIYDFMGANVDRVDFGSLGLCDSCSKLRNILFDGDNLFIVHDTVLLKSTDEGYTWLVESQKAPYLYAVNNNTVYSLQLASFIQSSNFFQAADLVLYKVNNNLSTQITDNEHKRHTGNLALTDFHFMSNDTIIAVGKNKLISMSYNGGKNWDLKSTYMNHGIYWINKKFCYGFQSNNSINGQVLKSTDGGVTFLPQKYQALDYSLFKLPIDFSHFDSEGNCLIFRKHLISDNNNLMLSNDYGETFRQINIERLNGEYNILGKTFVNKNDTALFLFFSYYSKLSGYFRFAYEFDKELNYKKEIYIQDSITVIDIKEFNNSYRGLIRERKYPYNLDTKDTNLRYHIAHSDDLGFTWTFDMTFDTKDTLLTDIFVFDDDIYLRGYYLIPQVIGKNYIYKVDKDNKNYTEILYDTLLLKGLYQFDHKIFVPNQEYFLINHDIANEPKNWERIEMPGLEWGGMIPFENHFYVGGVNWQKNIHSYFKFTKKTPSSVVNEPVVRTQFWADLPYPIPARNYVNAEIYWDLRHDINKADIAVYNLYGEKIEGKENIVLNASDTYKGILSWDCSHAGAGIYFIRIIHGDAVRAITVVVEK